jgi:Arc/MetJ-type ribon-helix-helix transcriptional regulator
MYYVSRTVTLRLPEDLDVLLTEVCRRSGRSQSEVIREALRRQLELERFEQLRRRVLPFAEARGYLTDEDVFRDLS